MKKFLLSIATVAFCGGMASAATTTLNMSNFNADDVDGTHVETTYKDDGSVQAWEHYQPLNSLMINGFEFDFSAGANEKNAPALYNSSKGTWTVRLYVNNTMTISAPEGVEMGKITFKTTNGNADFTATADKGSLTMNYTSATNQNVVWQNSTPVSTITITVGGTIRIESMEIDSEGGQVAPPVDPGTNDHFWSALNENDAECDWTFENVVLPSELTYVWIWKEYNGKHYLNGSAYLKTDYAAEAYAISPVVDLAEVENATVSFEHTAKFQKTLRDYCGFVVREEGGQWAELTIPNWPAEGNWTFVNSGDIKLDDNFVGKKVQFGFKYGSTAAGADTWEIRNFVVNAMSTGVASLNEAQDAVYFDLCGRRVINPTQGIFVKVQGNKATKVIVK